MQFKNAEVLYFLPLLIIPILVHLFQLQKFVKVPFTNVAFLKKLVQQTRKSSQIKKWLILTTRLLLFTAIIFAFSQPYFGDKKANNKQHTFIYLDNSLSMDTKGEKGNLLKVAAQEIIENTSENEIYSLQTNSNFYKEINKSELKNHLINTEKTSKKLNLETLLLKINTESKNKINTLDKTILISDFQNNYINKFTNVTIPFSAIQLNPTQKNNISIDSVFISNSNASNFTLNISIKNQGPSQSNIPISIFDKNKLMSKQIFSIGENENNITQFTLQNTPTFSGKIVIPFNDTYAFDNTFYFHLNTAQKIRVLSLGKEAKYFSKIYTESEFEYTSSSLQNINYNSLPKQEIIILNELKNIPDILSKRVLAFSKKGGHLVIIPAKDLDLNSYNKFLSKLKIGRIESQKKDTLKITSIKYEHPFFLNVFSKKVLNFQYPKVYTYSPISSKNSSDIISFENGIPFIQKIKNKSGIFYWISSALNNSNSNFLNSPLIVPVFYNFGKLSFQHSQLYYTVQKENTIDIPTQTSKDEILTISTNKNSFIPQQRRFQNKVAITTKEQPLKAGFYSILKGKDSIQKLAFNYPKEESQLSYLDINELKKQYSNSTVSSSIKEAFKNLNEKNEVHWLWKWFLGLAIVSLFLEILILKFYKT